jgi:ribosomal protein L44E
VTEDISNRVKKLTEGLQKWRDEGSPTKSRQERFDEKPTRKLAIDLMCVQCFGGEGEAGLRDSIRDCTAWECPLRMYRPYQ